jgi:hypothetical protein
MKWPRRSEISLFDRQREARVRPEHAALYPSVRSDRWIPVGRLLRRIRRDVDLASRDLLQAHFEFREGLGPRNPAWPFLRQREEDVPPVLGGAGERLGRLRDSYSRLYPGIRPGQWQPARELRDKLRQLRELEEADRPARQPAAPPPKRALPDEHFEFCLGMSDPGFPRLRTRWEDPTLRGSAQV